MQFLSNFLNQNFLLENIDFWILLYSTSFIFLAFLTNALARIDDKKFDWNNLFYFAVFQALLRVSVLVLVDNPNIFPYLGFDNFFLFFNLIETFSFVFLFVFSFPERFRSLSDRNKMILFSVSLLVIFLLVYFYPLFFSNYLRLFIIGSSSFVFSLLFLREFLKSEDWGLIPLSVFFVLYAILTIFSERDLVSFVESLINERTTTLIFGLPVQIYWFLFIFCFCLFVFSYYTKKHIEKLPFILGQNLSKHEYWLGVFFVIFFSFLFSGFFVMNFVGNIAKQEEVRRASYGMDISANSAEHLFEMVDHLAVTLSGSPVFSSLNGANFSRSEIDLINSGLDRYSEIVPGFVVYFLDVNGVTIASSNRELPESFVGKDYSFRPYFKESLISGSSNYIALGVTSNVAGYYSGRLVKNEKGQNVGVVVIKTDFSHIASVDLGRDKLFFVDKNGIIVGSSDGKYLLGQFEPVKEDVIKKLLDSKQYSKINPIPVLGGIYKTGDWVSLDNQTFYLLQKELKFGNLDIFLLSKIEKYTTQRFSIIIILLFFIILLCTFVFYQVYSEEITGGIENSKNDLRRILDHLNEAIIVVDQNDKIIEFNKRTESLFGVGGAALDKISLNKDLFPDNCQLSVRSVWNELASGENKTLQCAGRNSLYDTRFDAEIFITFLEISGRKLAMMVVNDITDHKKLEKDVLERNKELETMNKLMVGRELKMVELKKEIEELKNTNKA